MEAEKSTFQGELFFQRSECTAGLTVSGYIFFVLLIKTILSKQLRKTLKSAKMIYICILYLKSLETYLETLHSHFQPNCYFKMFKNSGSVLLIGQEICTVCTGGHGITEPEFLNTLKCNLAESARTGFQFN
jgi:hypothetical protein